MENKDSHWLNKNVLKIIKSLFVFLYNNKVLTSDENKTIETHHHIETD